MFSRELKKGNTELLVLSLLEARPRHGYEIGQLIEERSGGKLRYRITAEGRKALRNHRTLWQEFIDAVNRVTRPDHA